MNSGNVTNGSFVISLDYELFWGILGFKTIESYKNNVLNVEHIVPQIIETFRQYEISATWAVVGLLTYPTLDELKKSIPNRVLKYKRSALCPYTTARNFSKNPKLLLGKDLLECIINEPNQAVGSHSFAHIYSEEEAISNNVFEEDCKLLVKRLSDFGVSPKSYIFPINEVIDEHLNILKENGFTVYRGKVPNKLLNSTRLTNKIIRVLDDLLNLTGHHIYSYKNLYEEKSGLVNIPGSQFLRPVSGNKLIDRLRIKRIKDSMLAAAKQNKIYHLWWHPHNFGNDVKRNINNLIQILEYYKVLNKEYNFTSRSMEDISATIKPKLTN